MVGPLKNFYATNLVYIYVHFNLRRTLQFKTEIKQQHNFFFSGKVHILKIEKSIEFQYSSRNIFVTLYLTLPSLLLAAAAAILLLLFLFLGDSS